MADNDDTDVTCIAFLTAVAAGMRPGGHVREAARVALTNALAADPAIFEASRRFVSDGKRFRKEGALDRSAFRNLRDTADTLLVEGIDHYEDFVD